MPQYSLVLIGRYPGKDMAVAQALARCMGREEAWGLRVVSAAPIIFFENLPERHAELAKSALKEVCDAGCKFEIETGANPAYPKVGWAQTPRIFGRDLAEIARTSETTTLHPHSSEEAHARAHSSAAATSSALPAVSDAPPSAASATLYLPCPYTGQRMRLTISVTLTKDGGGTRINVGASAAPAAPKVPAETPTPATSLHSATATTSPSGSSSTRTSVAPTGTIILPTASQIKSNSGPFATQRNKTGPIPVPYPAPQSDTGVNLRDKNAMVTTTVARPMSSENTLPAASWRRKTPHEVPLPDVPVLPGMGRAASDSQRPERNNLPLNSKPMDLSAFEEQFGAPKEKAERPFVDAGPYAQSDSSVGLTMIEDDDMMDPVELCSVFIERSSNPIVHELVAELHGIPEAEASEMCVSGSVALAENIPLDEANDIKQRCAAINVNARIEKLA